MTASGPGDGRTFSPSFTLPEVLFFILRDMKLIGWVFRFCFGVEIIFVLGNENSTEIYD